MANRYWVGGGATADWNATGNTNWGSASNTRDNASVPTSSDDCIFDNSANGNSPCTVNSGNAICKSLDMTAYTNTLTHNTVAINTFGNVVFGSSMTYTQVTGAYINFSAAGTLTSNGKTMPSLIATTKITLGDNINFSAATTLYVKLDATGTALDLNGKTLSGNSTINRVLIYSGTTGTGKTLLINSGTLANADFQDITFSSASNVDLSAITGGSGDCGGNTITGGGTTLTFTTSVPQHWISATGGNWSDVTKWTSRIPLVQDDVYFDNAFSASQTVTANKPRLGRSIDWTGATGSPTLSLGSTGNTVYGNWTFISGMTRIGTQGTTFAGRGNFSITNAGIAWGGGTTFAAPGGTYTSNDAYSNTSGSAWTLSNGTYVDGGFTHSANQFSVSASTTRNLTKTGVWTTTSTGASTVWNAQTTTGLTFSDTGTLIISGATANTRTFVGGGLTYGTLTYTVAGSTGELDITGSNSFAQINFSDASNARSLKFTKATQTTIRNGNGFNVRGTTGKLMTIDTIDGAGTFTLTSPNVQSTDYMNVIRSTVDASPKWYAGANSTDGTGNTNWLFQAGYAYASATAGKSMSEIEYSAYATVNGVGSGLTLAEQKLKYFSYKLGYQPASVRDGEVSFLRLVTGSGGTDIRAMWNRYATGLGGTSLNTEEEIKKNVFLNIGLPY